MTLLAAFQAPAVSLQRADGHRRGHADRQPESRPELEPLIGFFVNTLVAADATSGDRRIPRSCSVGSAEVALGAYAHQDLPFEMLRGTLQPQRDLSRNPLFQVMFVLHNTPAAELETPSA